MCGAKTSGYFVGAIKIQSYVFGLLQTLVKKEEVGESCNIHQANLGSLEDNCVGTERGDLMWFVAY
jgi:hypothetical protein